MTYAQLVSGPYKALVSVWNYFDPATKGSAYTPLQKEEKWTLASYFRFKNRRSYLTIR